MGKTSRYQTKPKITKQNVSVINRSISSGLFTYAIFFNSEILEDNFESDSSHIY